MNGKTLYAADRREAGSAGEDAGAGDAAGLHAVEGRVLRRASTRRRPRARRRSCATRSPTLRPQAPAARRRTRWRRWTRRSRRSSRRPAPAAGRGRGGRGGGRGGGAAAAPDRSAASSAALAGVMNLLQGADVRPTAVQLKAIATARTTAATTMAKWTAIKAVDMVSTNTALKAAGLAVLTLTTTPAAATPTPQQPAAPAAVQQASASDRADALSEAARRGDAAKVKQLLDDGVDVNTKFRYDRTALSFAADRGHLEVVKLLSSAAPTLNVKDTFYNATAADLGGQPGDGTHATARRDREAAAAARCARARSAPSWRRSARMPRRSKVILDVGRAVGRHALRRAGSGDASEEAGDRDAARAGGREAAARVQDGRGAAGALRRHLSAAPATRRRPRGPSPSRTGASSRRPADRASHAVARDATTFGVAGAAGHRR